MNLPYDLEAVQLVMPPVRLETIQWWIDQPAVLARPGQLQ